MRQANCAKVSGRPAGMVRSASQTLRWKDVPRISSAISSPAFGEDKKRRILNISSFTARSLRMNTSSGKIFPSSISSSSAFVRSEEHTSELQSPDHLVCRLLLEKKNKDRT